MVGAVHVHVLRTLTADDYASQVIASRFRIYSGQARTASLAVTVRITAPVDLLRRRTRVALTTDALGSLVRCDRFTFIMRFQ